MPERGRRLVYRNARWEIDLGRRELRRDGVGQPLGGRAFDIMAVLVEAAGQVVTTDALMARVWPGAVVGENMLHVHISAIRKVLGQDRGLVATAYGRGYRLLGTWASRSEAAPPEPAPLPVPPTVARLPVAASAFVGREEPAKKLRTLLSAYRAVTLTGPGGIGKTRLALHVAADLAGQFAGNAWLVDLAALSEPRLVPSAVAGTLGLEIGVNPISTEAVARAVGDTHRLVLLDNCEHVIEAAANMVEALIRHCSGTTVLATSREPLGIAGEFVYAVAPLKVPPADAPPAEAARRYSAVELFITRMRALNADLRPDAGQIAAIAAICRRLDGIPLAIEFAAARAATLGPDQVLTRLDDRFGLLISHRRTALPRHRTLRATLDWSYQLLPENERRLLGRLAVYAAGFTIEAAQAVTGDIVECGATVTGGIASLVTKSLIVLDETGPVGRWRLLETTRAYALAKLAERGELEATRRRTAEYFAGWLSSESEWSLPAEQFVRFMREIDNVRAALDWAFSAAGDEAIGVMLTAAYVPVWLRLSLMAECRERSERALASPAAPGLEPRLRVQLHIALGIAIHYTSVPGEALVYDLGPAIEIAEAGDDVDARLRTLWATWNQHCNLGDYLGAQSALDAFCALARHSGDTASIVVADQSSGYWLHYCGDHQAARRQLDLVFATETRLPDRHYASWLGYDQLILARTTAARILFLQGHVEQGAAMAQATLDESQALGHTLSRCFVLAHGSSRISMMAGDRVGAGRHIATLIDLATRHAFPYWLDWGHCLEGERLIRGGDFAHGLSMLRGPFERSDDGRFKMRHPHFVCVIAEGLAGLGELVQARASIDEALDIVNRGGQRWCGPELHRLKGEFHRPHMPMVAETCFTAALAMAGEQGALFWELRAALSFARLRIDQQREAEAKQILQPVHDRFTEGFQTADLREATAVLARF